MFVNVVGGGGESHSEKSLKNVKEAQFIVRWFQEISKKFPHIDFQKRVGVITPYRQRK